MSSPEHNLRSPAFSPGCATVAQTHIFCTFRTPRAAPVVRSRAQGVTAGERSSCAREGGQGNTHIITADDPGTSTLAALQQGYRRFPAPAARLERLEEMSDLTVPVQIERCASLSTKVQQSRHRARGTGPGVGGCAGVCETRDAGNDPLISPDVRGKKDQTPCCLHLSDAVCCDALKTGAKGGVMLQESLPGVLDHREFSRVRGRSAGATPAGWGRQSTP
jgi:hypothetical protein